MAISDTLSSIATNLSNAYDALSAKGATIPAFKNIENLASAIATISAGGGIDEGIEAMLNKSIYTYESSRINIPAYAFYMQTNLSSVSLSRCQTIERYAFYGAGLLNIYLPNLQSLSSGAFAAISASYIELPQLSRVPESAFMYAFSFFINGKSTLKSVLKNLAIYFNLSITESNKQEASKSYFSLSKSVASI